MSSRRIPELVSAVPLSCLIPLRYRLPSLDDIVDLKSICVSSSSLIFYETLKFRIYCTSPVVQKSTLIFNTWFSSGMVAAPVTLCPAQDSTVSLHQCITVLQCHYITVSLHYSVTVLQCHYITVSRSEEFHCVSLYHCITGSLHLAQRIEDFVSSRSSISNDLYKVSNGLIRCHGLGRCPMV